MAVSENCSERKGHPVHIGWISEWVITGASWFHWIIRESAQTKIIYSRAFPGQLGEGHALKLMACDNLNFWRASIAPLAPFLFPPWTVQGLPGHTIHFFRLKGRPYHVCYKYYMKSVFKVELPLPSSQMMDFVFLLPEGQESGHFCIYQSTWSFPPSYPRALSLSYARNQLVWCSDLHWVRHNSGSLCALISLNKWKVKCLKVGQLWGCSKTSVLVVCFSGF